MKKIIATIILICGINFSSKAQITDTIQWLQLNIDQRQTLFIHKPLSTMFDSLYTLKNCIKQYLTLESETDTRPDTLWTQEIVLYFGEPWGGGDVTQLHIQYPDSNTHVPFIKVEFFNPVPFLRKWISIDLDGLGSVDWNPQLEAFWGRYWVKSIRVGEY